MKIEEMQAFDDFIRKKYYEGVLWNNGIPTHPLYADLYDAWLASAKRQGYKFVPVDDKKGIDYEYMEQNYKAK